MRDLRLCLFLVDVVTHVDDTKGFPFRWLPPQLANTNPLRRVHFFCDRVGDRAQAPSRVASGFITSLYLEDSNAHVTARTVKV